MTKNAVGNPINETSLNALSQPTTTSLRELFRAAKTASARNGSVPLRPPEQYRRPNPTRATRHFLDLPSILQEAIEIAEVDLDFWEEDKKAETSRKSSY